MNNEIKKSVKCNLPSPIPEIPNFWNLPIDLGGKGILLLLYEHKSRTGEYMTKYELFHSNNNTIKEFEFFWNVAKKSSYLKEYFAAQEG